VYDYLWQFVEFSIIIAKITRLIFMGEISLYHMTLISHAR
jgi:hypothetical protein